jgi:hypothetical protein
MLESPTPIAGLPLRATASAVRGGITGHLVHLTVEVSGRDLALRDEAGLALNDVDFEYAAMDMRGTARARGKGTLNLRLLPVTQRAFGNRSVRYVTEFDLPPGRYQLRVAARERIEGRSGSLFYDLEVPDFDGLPLSVSDLLITSSSAGLSPTVREQVSLERGMPGPTSTARDLPRTDTLTACAWLYTSGGDAVHTVDLTASMKADDGSEVFRRDDVLSSRALDVAQGGYTVRLHVPLARLNPGRHVLTISVRSRLSGEVASKEVEFRIAGRP